MEERGKEGEFIRSMTEYPFHFSKPEKFEVKRVEMCGATIAKFVRKNFDRNCFTRDSTRKNEFNLCNIRVSFE